LNVRIASSREVVTAGANAPTIFGRENNTNPKHDEKEKTGYREHTLRLVGFSEKLIYHTKQKECG
jgi:hypothetical protein